MSNLLMQNSVFAIISGDASGAVIKAFKSTQLRQLDTTEHDNSILFYSILFYYFSCIFIYVIF